MKLLIYVLDQKRLNRKWSGNYNYEVEQSDDLIFGLMKGDFRVPVDAATGKSFSMKMAE